MNHRFSIVNFDLKKFNSKEKIYILNSRGHYLLKVEKYSLTLMYRASLNIKYNLNKYGAKELIDKYFENETYNLLKENYLKTNDSELISMIKDFNFEMKIEKQLNENTKFIIRASFLQIYNENISDLLKPDKKNLQIREDKKKGLYVDLLSEY